MGLTQSVFDRLIKENETHRVSLASKLEEVATLLRQDKHNLKETRLQ